MYLFFVNRKPLHVQKCQAWNVVQGAGRGIRLWHGTAEASSCMWAAFAFPLRQSTELCY